MATVYVDPAGDNSRSYAQAQVITTPWKTLGKCQTSAVTGDTIIMLPGTHTDPGNNVGYTLTKSFTIQGLNAPTYPYGVATWDTILDAANAQWGIGPQNSGDISLTLRNLELRNYKCLDPGSDYAFGIGGGAGTSQATALDVQYCKFKTWGIGSTYVGGGVFAGALTNDTLMTWTIKNNIFDDIYDSNVGGISYIFGIAGGSVANVFAVTDNIFYLTRTVAAEMLESLWADANSGASVLTWKNNIVRSAASLPFYKTGGAYAAIPNQTVNNNLHYQISGVPSGTGNLTSDPLFIDAASGNFNLQPGSPSIGTGTTS